MKKHCIARIISCLLTAVMTAAYIIPPTVSAETVSSETYEKAYVTASSSQAPSPENLDKIEKMIRNALDRHTEKIALTPHIKFSYIQRIFDKIVSDPDYGFYVKGMTQYESDQNGNVYYIYVSYYFGKKDARKATDAGKKAVKSIVSGINKNWTDFQKCAYVHDAIILLSRYDESAPHCSSAYGPLVDHAGVCEGYSEAYRMILGQIGINCETALNIPGTHEWNIVELDGKWYHVDVTQDDPIGGLNGNALHTYFLKSDSAIKDSGDHSEWDAPHKATSKKYDKISWADSYTPFSIYQSSVIYTTTDGKLISFDTKTSKIKTLMVNDTQWFKSPTEVYNIKFWGTAVKGSTLYYNDQYSVWSYDLKTGKKRKVADVAKKNGGLTALTIKNGNIYGYYFDDKEGTAPKLIKKLS